MPYDIAAIRRAFPILNRTVSGHSLAYLDSAATSQKPESVLAVMEKFHRTDNANINRGVHPLAEASTVAFDHARSTVAAFIGAKPHETIFTKNATEGINLVARSFGEHLQKGDAIALTMMEHHSNIVPWMQLAKRRNIELRWIPIDKNGQLNVADVKNILEEGTVKLLALTGLSNVLGSMPPMTKITALAHEHGAKVLVDGAQLIAHAPVNVRKIDCDFLVFSAHKLYGPTGIGVLYGKEELLSAMPPFLGGGDMIASVRVEGFTPAELPRKFEAGTPPISEAVGLGAAIEWIDGVGMTEIAEHESGVLTHAYERLSKTKDVTILGPQNAIDRLGCISFTVEGIHPHDLTQLLGEEGICLRAGHHCTEPLHRSLGINASARLSVAAYTTIEEIDRCVEGIEKAKQFLTGTD